MGGCNMANSPPTIIPPVTSSIGLVTRYVSSTDWLNTLFLLSMVCSVFAGLNGLKTGWAGAAASLLGIVMKGAMTQVWIYWILGVLLIVGVLLVGASILMKNQALVQIVKGVQRLKKHALTHGEELQHAQSVPTQRLVSKIKTDLKIKGDI